MQISINRSNYTFSPDSSRVIARFLSLDDKRSADIIRKVLAMPEKEVTMAMYQVLRGYSQRHRNISRIFEHNFTKLAPIFNQIEVNEEDLSATQKTLIGSYFTMEYSIESAAFFNPSIIEDPDQSGIRTNEKRVIFSFRATGEGHISSIVFRSGILDMNNSLITEPVGKMLAEADVIKLYASHYEINFSIDSAISERVIFPVSASEQKGIEDARFVKFTEDNGEITYYATYTAFDGVTTLPKLISTTDFYNFKILPINGKIVQNKGMALFPRKIDGKYVMLCRIDGVNNYIAYSESINLWDEAKIIQQPKYPWELVQIGNAGSPIETDDGWLVITHAVGSMREYTLSASLFDLKNPEKEIGRLNTPLMAPNETEREGYVPNVIYSCGSIIHNDELVLPYAMSDHSSSYATIKVRELLDELKKSKGENNC